MSLPKRIQRMRTKGWKCPPKTLYCGRPTVWGNPFRTVDQYREWIKQGTWHRNNLAENFLPGFNKNELSHWLPNLRNSVRSGVPLLVKFKHLSCWCPLDEPCHVDVILELIRECEK